MEKYRDDIKKLAGHCGLAADFAKRRWFKVIDLMGTYEHYEDDVSFHPDGECGCVELDDDSLFGIRCDHLMWATGNTEGTDGFYTYPPKVNDRLGILLYGNHKGTLVVKLLIAGGPCIE